MNTDELLKSISNKSNILHYKRGDWNETKFSIDDTVFDVSRTYQCFEKGDIAIRAANYKIRMYVFDGERSAFFDQDFGAGSITHYGECIDFNIIFQYVFKAKYMGLFNALNSVLPNDDRYVIN